MSIGRLQAALASATNEVTVAASHINFDFTLVKYEAPKEFQPFGALLPATKKSEAETGAAHITARRLGALFEGVCPQTPNLLEAYGKRVSDISAAAEAANAPNFANSIFSAYSGIDGTSIWAAATSSKTALHIHLLACMLARIFKASEAISIWVELVKERRKDISTRLESGEEVPFSLAAAAAPNDVPKPQLAEWDASARAWLQTADETKKNENMQLQCLFKDIDIVVNQYSDVFPSVLEAWKSALEAMEKLVSGVPQAVQNGSILLGLSAWHLYPNLAVFGSQNFEVNMDDPLINPGGVLSLGLSPSSRADHSGVFWCLSLAYLRHYGKPVRTERALQDDPTRLTFNQFLFGALGAVMSKWRIPSSDTSLAMRLFAMSFTELKKAPQFRQKAQWVSVIREVASSYLSMTGNDAEYAFKLVQIGRRRAESFLGAKPTKLKTTKLKTTKLKTKEPPFFGLLEFNHLLQCLKSPEARVTFLRYIILKTPGIDLKSTVIRYQADDQKEVFLPGQRNNSIGEKVILVNIETIIKEEDNDDLENKIEENTSERYHYATIAPTWGPFFNRITTSEDIKATPESILASRDHRWLPKEMGGSKVPKIEQCHFFYADPIRKYFHEKAQNDSEGPVNNLHPVCGDPSSAIVLQLGSSKKISPPKIGLEDVLWCLEAGLFSEMELGELIIRGLRSKIVELFVALTHLHAIYYYLPDATIALQCFEKQLLGLKWCKGIIRKKEKKGTVGKGFENLSRGRCLAAIAFLDSGMCDLDPTDLENVIALSSGDSIYVSKKLICDPAERPKPYHFQRILGNIGKPGVVLLTPPQNPMIREVDYRRLMAISENIFDGKKMDCFSGTSLHLSFTDYHVPLYDTNVRIGQDSQVSVIESVISIHDSGEWVADVNILEAVRSVIVGRNSLSSSCVHENDATPELPIRSVESWEDILDCPVDDVVIRAHGNSLARLAAASVLVQVMAPKRNASIIACREDMCWRCHQIKYPCVPHCFIF